MSYIAYHELNQEHKNKLIKRQAIERLTTDDPHGNVFIMLNYAYRGDDGNVKLRYGNGEENIDLCEYIAQESIVAHCGLSAKDVMEGACIEGCDCPLAILYTVAVQAAELRERLKMYEDAGIEPPKVGDASG